MKHLNALRCEAAALPNGVATLRDKWERVNALGLDPGNLIKIGERRAPVESSHGEKESKQVTALGLDPGDLANIGERRAPAVSNRWKQVNALNSYSGHLAKTGDRRAPAESSNGSFDPGNLAKLWEPRAPAARNFAQLWEPRAPAAINLAQRWEPRAPAESNNEKKTGADHAKEGDGEEQARQQLTRKRKASVDADIKTEAEGEEEGGATQVLNGGISTSLPFRLRSPTKRQRVSMENEEVAVKREISEEYVTDFGEVDKELGECDEDFELVDADDGDGA